MANDQISYPMIPLKTWWELRKKGSPETGVGRLSPTDGLNEGRE